MDDESIDPSNVNHEFATLPRVQIADDQQHALVVFSVQATTSAFEWYFRLFDSQRTATACDTVP